MLQNWSSWAWVRGGGGLNYVVVTRNRILNANELNSITVSWMRSHVPLGIHKKEEKEFGKKNWWKNPQRKEKPTNSRQVKGSILQNCHYYCFSTDHRHQLSHGSAKGSAPAGWGMQKKKKINSSIVITCPIASMKYAPAQWTLGKPSAATVWKVEKSKGKRRRQHKRNKSNNVKHWVRIRLRHSVWIALSRCGGGGWSAGTGNCWPHRPRQSMERLWLLNG